MSCVKIEGGGPERFLHKGHKMTSMIKGDVSHKGSV